MRHLGLILALLCASPVALEAQAKRGDRNMITRQDLEEARAAITNAQEAVQRLRPQWLRGPMGRMSSSGMDGQRGASATEPILYIDDRRQPDLEQLRTVPIATLVELRFLEQNRAIQLLGPGHEAGALLVTTSNKR